MKINFAGGVEISLLKRNRPFGFLTTLYKEKGGEGGGGGGGGGGGPHFHSQFQKPSP